MARSGSAPADDAAAPRHVVIPGLAGRSSWLGAIWTGAGSAVLCALAGIIAVAICWLPVSGTDGRITSTLRAGLLTFLGALQTSPDMSAAALFPKPAAANQAIFFDGGRPRAVAEVMDLLKAKVGTAMGEGVDAVAPGTSFAYAASTQAFQAAQADFAPAAPTASSAPAPRRASMAETLQATFGGSDRIGARAAQRIDEAYGKFRAFGL